MAKIPVQFRLNGTDRAAFVDAPETLLNMLRRSLGDFAPKYGCGQGACGVCTVLIPCLSTRLTVNGIQAKGQSFPRVREGRPFSTSALAFCESWTEAR